MSHNVKLEVLQLPNGEGLALPAYQSALAAGLDLLAAVPEDAPVVLAPGKYALVPTGLRGASAAALRPCGQARRDRAERAGHGGCGLSRRNRGAPDQPQRCTLYGPARRTYRPDGDCVRGPGGTRPGDDAFLDHARRRRLWLNRPVGRYKTGRLFLKKSRER